TTSYDAPANAKAYGGVEETRLVAEESYPEESSDRQQAEPVAEPASNHEPYHQTMASGIASSHQYDRVREIEHLKQMLHSHETNIEAYIFRIEEALYHLKQSQRHQKRIIER